MSSEEKNAKGNSPPEHENNGEEQSVRSIPEQFAGRKWFSTRETAFILGVNRETVRYWKKKGVFVPEIEDYRGYFYYSREQIEQLASVYRKDWNDTYKLLGGDPTIESEEDSQSGDERNHNAGLSGSERNHNVGLSGSERNHNVGLSGSERNHNVGLSGSERNHNVGLSGSERNHNVRNDCVKSDEENRVRKIPPGKWFSLRETALIIGVSRESIRKWKKKGIFVPAKEDHDGRLFYSREQVEQLASVYCRDWNDTYKLLDGDPTVNVETVVETAVEPVEKSVDVPSALKSLNSWVLHKKKVPMSVRMRDNKERVVKVDVTKQGVTFLSHEKATEALMTHIDEVDGLGFVLDKEVAPIVCIDLDGLNNSFKDKILSELDDTYVEHSPSGEGLHVWFIDHELEGLSGRRIKDIEIYCDKRYMTFTGHHLEGCAEELATHDGYMRSLIVELFDKGEDKETYEKLLEQADFNVEPDIDDEQLVAIIENSNDVVMKKLLFEGNPEGYRSRSEADWHLALKLCWWTAGNFGQIKRLFDTSPLADRDKWENREEDYALRTIVRAHSVWDRKAFKPSKKGKSAKQIARELEIEGLTNALLVPHGYAINERGIFKLGGDDD
ncbi:MAG: MerR family transcriptional regulator, partial [Selenomonadaceae bacterium]|nr:MerR family transcriptional regulator [Selenomonadaceae bacterium]